MTSFVAIRDACARIMGPLLLSLTLLACGARPDNNAVKSGAADTADAPAAASQLTDVSQLDSRPKQTDPESLPGAAVYRTACASCHEGQVAKAPHKMFLQMLSGPSIHDSLRTGLMQQQAAALTDAQKSQVAEYLSGAPLASQQAPALRMCTASARDFDLGEPPQTGTWGYDNARFVGAAEAGISAAQANRLALRWAFAFPNAIRARSQPSLAFGAVYVGSHDGHVYALDQKSGCVRWAFKAAAEVRSAIVPYAATGGPNVRTQSPRVFFGDVIGRVYSLDALTGKLRFSSKVDDHPNATLTGTATYHDGVFLQPVSSLEVTSAADPKYPCCSFRGAVVAIDAWSGEQRYKAYTIAKPPAEVAKTKIGTPVLAPSGAPVWNSPLIDTKRGVFYVGTGENYSSPANETSDALLAFSLTDGSLKWSQQALAGDAWNVACMMQNNPNCPAENGPDVDFGAGVILVSLPNGRQLLVAGQKNGVVHAFDPDRKGATVWQTRVGRGGIQGGVHFGMAADGARIYVPISDMRDGRDGRPVDGPPRPGLYALDAADGRLLWSQPTPDRCGKLAFCDPGISAAITATPEVVYAGHMDGYFRAYDANSGKVLFDFDSKRDIVGVNGVSGRGGSFGGAGPAVRNGWVVVNSGYGLYFHMPGNLLLAFAVP